MFNDFNQNITSENFLKQRKPQFWLTKLVCCLHRDCTKLDLDKNIFGFQLNQTQLDILLWKTYSKENVVRRIFP